MNPGGTVERILAIHGGDANGQLGMIFFRRVRGLPRETSIHVHD